MANEARDWEWLESDRDASAFLIIAMIAAADQFRAQGEAFLLNTADGDILGNRLKDPLSLQAESLVRDMKGAGEAAIKVSELIMEAIRAPDDGISAALNPGAFKKTREAYRDFLAKEQSACEGGAMFFPDLVTALTDLTGTE